MRVDFTSQAFFQNPAAGIEKLRACGPVVETRFPIVGKVWITTTYESRRTAALPGCDGGCRLSSAGSPTIC